uniref:Uncharacterized protein n=1 Tax=Cannabis sativa TaxID=3483 RepID=A0A803QQ41_CANSA
MRRQNRVLPERNHASKRETPVLKDTLIRFESALINFYRRKSVPAKLLAPVGANLHLKIGAKSFAGAIDAPTNLLARQ